MKKTTILIVAAQVALSLNTNAQTTGPWDVSGTAQTSTSSQVAIGAAAIGAVNAWQHIHYCTDQEYGLVITKGDCGNPYVVGIPDVTYDGVEDVLSLDGPGPVFNSPIDFFLTGYNTSDAKPMIWARQENSPSIFNASGSHTSRFMVTPYGRSGFNIENPRATLDIKSLGGFNFPAMIIGRQKPTTVNRTQHIHIVPFLEENGYNENVVKYDQGLFFTDGMGTDGSNTNGAFVIAPWADQADPDVASIGGIRINKDGDLQVFGSITTDGMVMTGNSEVRGTFKALEIQVRPQWWPDFVFAVDYELMPLREVESYIKQNHHLPGVPSEADIKASNLGVAAMMAVHMQKIEELTLYTIEQDKKIKYLEETTQMLLERIEKLETQQK